MQLASHVHALRSGVLGGQPRSTRLASSATAVASWVSFIVQRTLIRDAAREGRHRAGVAGVSKRDGDGLG